jgi:dihydroorotate dehydrogenase (NAD+) catalytic subunit
LQEQMIQLGQAPTSRTIPSLWWLLFESSAKNRTQGTAWTRGRTKNERHFRVRTPQISGYWNRPRKYPQLTKCMSIIKQRAIYGWSISQPNDLDFLQGRCSLPNVHAKIPQVTVPSEVDLSVSVDALRLSNPILAASGTFGYGVEFAHLVDLNRLGGIVVKGLSLEPMAGAPAPRLCETPSGMLNAVGLQNIGVRAFVAEKLPALRQYRCAIVANVFGSTVEEYCAVIRILEEADGLAAYELNISCPNTAHGGLQFGSDPGMVAEVVAASRRAAGKRPLWVKLSPNVTDITVIARAAADAGADALTVANTYQGMSVDVRTRKSRLGKVKGGLSGPAIRPLTVRLVYEASQAVNIPIIGLGGVEKPGDILEYMIVGATAVQIGTANFTDPTACERMIGGLDKLCKDIKVNAINKLIGSLVADSGWFKHYSMLRFLFPQKLR